jgi:hypothetical protein
MNRARIAKSFLWIGVVAALGAAELASAGGTQGGTITFAGAIVAPGYEVGVAPVSTATSNNTIGFSSMAGSPSSLTVRAVSLDGAPLSMRCTQNSTARTSTTERCGISGSGGSVELARKAAQPGAPSNAIVVINYN